MADSIQFRRGLRSTVKPLPVGMPGFVEDEERLVIGKGDGTNAELPNKTDIDNINSQMADNTKLLFLHGKKTNDFLGINGSGGSATKEYGFKYCRNNPTWADIEKTQGVYDWSVLDQNINVEIENGQIPWIMLGYHNPLYGTSGLDDTSIPHFVEYASAIANKYKGKNICFEFWNEPNQGETIKPYVYVNVLQQLYANLKNIDSTCTIIGGAFAASLLDTWFEKACQAGILNYLDKLCIHIYTGTAIPEQMTHTINVIKTMIKTYSEKDIPIVIGETGWSIVPNWNGNGNNSVLNDDTRAIYTQRIILWALMNNIEQLLIYGWRTTQADNTNVEDWFGIMNKDGTPTLTAIAIKNLMMQIKDLIYLTGYILNQNDYILLFSDNDKFYILFWTTASRHTGFNDLNFTNTPQKIEITDISVLPKLKKYNPIISNVFFKYKHNVAINNNNITLGDHALATGNSTASDANSFASGLSSSAIVGGLYEVLAQTVNTNTLILSNVDNLSIGDTIYLITLANGIIEAKIINITDTTITLDRAYSKSIYYCVKSIANKYCATAMGYSTIATEIGSHAQNYGTIANSLYSTAMGQFNKLMSSSDLVAIGNGTGMGSAYRNNAFRIQKNGNVFGTGAFNSTGADYAEYFEWLDGNFNKEDRVGYFVTLDGEKIRKCTSSDNFILGIVSVAPAIIGDSYQDDWKEKYMTDDWGRIQYHDVSVEEVRDNLGNIIVPAHTELQPQINPDWDSTEQYIPREKRLEWSPVGMIGKLLVRDDGTCEVNNYCKPNDNGIATKNNSGYRVLKRINNNIIMILFK